MTTRFSARTAGAMAFLGLACIASGRTININLHQAGSDVSRSCLAAGEVAGVVPVDGMHWNNIGFSGGDVSGKQCQAEVQLKDDRGDSDAGRFRSTLTSGYVSFSGAAHNGQGGDFDLMNSYLAFDTPDDGAPPDDKGCLAISGLRAPFTTQGYRVYLYFDCDANNRMFAITLTPDGSAAQTRTGTDSGTFSGEFVETTGGGTYANLAVFHDLKAPSFTITMDSSFGRGAISGIQIVSGDHVFPPSIDGFTTDDGYVKPGTKVTLAWQVEGAERLEIQPGIGDVTARTSNGKGSVTVTPGKTTTYTLKAMNSGGSADKKLLIGVGPSRPNIVYFFIDDMGWQDTSVPFHTEVTALNKRYHTPNMERLADQGMKFTQAYACAVCSPSRVSLMTGMNAARHGVTNWTLRKDKEPDRNHPKIQAGPWNLNGLCPVAGVPRTVHAVTLPMLLREAGYRTIHAGKAHFGAQDTPGESPLNLGFDINIAGHCAGGPGSYHGKNNYSAAFRKGDRIWDVPGLEKYHGTDTYLNEALTIEANKAVSQAVADGRPFYLYMSHYAVHAPWEQDDRFIKKYTDAGLKGLPAVFASMLESMDKSLGDIMVHLERLGVVDNTVLVFMSDNGCPSNLPRNLPLRGHKITPYEGGTRVPLIVKWPGVVEPKTTCNEYLIIEDIFPTFLEMAGVTGYKQIGGTIDGVSFVSQLKQKPTADPERPIFWHFPNTYGEPPYSSVRKGDWKLIYQHVTRDLELYNLREDIGETRNLAESNPTELQGLADVLTEHLRSCSAPMSIDKSTGKRIEYPSEILEKTEKKNGNMDTLQLKITPLPAASRAAIDAKRNAPYIQSDPEWYNWCPSVLKGDDGKYHMFHSRWPKSIGFLAWLTHSEIVHAVSDRPEGPYTVVDLAMPASGPDRGGWFTAHNVKIKPFGDRYYLYFCQTRGTDITDAKRVEIAKTGYGHPKWMSELRPWQRTFVATAESLRGPWRVSEKPIVEPAKTITTLTVNPAVCRGPDGTYFMIIKGDKPGEKRFIRNQALATAPTPTGPWTIQDLPVIDNLDTEDASVWYDQTRKRFYAVFHTHGFIGMMTSVDGYKWEKAHQYKLTPKVIPFDDGKTWKPDRMERPFVLTDEKGRPEMLFVACRKGNHSINVALPLVAPAFSR